MQWQIPTYNVDSYKLKLPKTIPPSYRGKSIRFNYYLVIGSQRSAPSFSAAKKSVGAQQGHVVQIPFRVLNHVSGNVYLEQCCLGADILNLIVMIVL